MTVYLLAHYLTTAWWFGCDSRRAAWRATCRMAVPKLRPVPTASDPPATCVAGTNSPTEKNTVWLKSGLNLKMFEKIWKNWPTFFWDMSYKLKSGRSIAKMQQINGLFLLGVYELCFWRVMFKRKFALHPPHSRHSSRCEDLWRSKAQQMSFSASREVSPVVTCAFASCVRRTFCTVSREDFKICIERRDDCQTESHFFTVKIDGYLWATFCQPFFWFRDVSCVLCLFPGLFGSLTRHFLGDPAWETGRKMSKHHKKNPRESTGHV